MGKGKKHTLKAALSSQQSRLKKKQEIEQAAKLSEQKGKKQKLAPGRAKDTHAHAGPFQPQTPPTIPFTSSDKILLVGEGNFSFTRALVVDAPAPLQYLPAENVVATAYDEEKECYAKYPEAEGIVGALRERGVTVLFQVDATRLEKCHALKGRTFDKIVWNFPHAGKGITDQDRNILSNQLLLLGFLRSASAFLARGPIPKVQSSGKGKAKQDDSEDEDDAETGGRSGSPSQVTTSSRGRILITLRNVAPYTLWDLPRLAKKPPPPQSAQEPPNPTYIQLRSFKFHREVWKGYEHRMTKGERAHGTGKTGQGGEDRTWEFCIAPRARHDAN
ncbi:hypothetical protein BXZ70DRAFT_940859 [Cristinia sonorae]|uniref:25S rRNA (uridine-N(3))-methyltransferase BMT5-like domain-containing protein n=1 Tax=Cristinia sonorae TaxID=1940300 RepID=A0A8K0ULT6_9AGAR|nr:hypothetical protein BXZ70DRAFT_940859 [Cristinia sonorae]